MEWVVPKWFFVASRFLSPVILSGAPEVLLRNGDKKRGVEIDPELIRRYFLSQVRQPQNA